MRKRDCIYLHALCALLRREVERRRDVDAEAFEAYERLDTGPSEIHRPKVDHREAVTELLDGISTALDGRPERPPLHADGGDRTNGDQS